MLPRASILMLASLSLTSCGLSCLNASAAEASAETIKLDGKTVYIPEVRLTRKINPVDRFLFIGASETKGGAGKNQKSLCAIDTKNNIIRIVAPERPLDGSRTRVVTQNGVDSFLDSISWGRRQVTQIAFKIISAKRQPAVIEINTNYNASLFLNGKFACNVTTDNMKISDGCGYFPVILETGENMININQFSRRGKPRIELAVSLDYSHDMRAAWQPQHGLLKRLVYLAGENATPVTLDWNPNLSNFQPSIEVRDIAANKTVFQKDHVRRGRVMADEGADLDLAPGIYEVVYRTESESASEQFIIGNPDDLFAQLQNALSQYNPDTKSKLDIEAQVRRASILLLKDNYDVFDRQWQEKAAYTLGSLATMECRLKEGASDIAKDQPGLHIRGFTAGADGSSQFYRLYIPSTYKPGELLPLLVIPSARVLNKQRSFIEGPTMANNREAMLWAKYAEQYGFALLWPGYRGGGSEGYTYDSVHIEEAIQAVEKDYAIDRHRISLYATCGAGYNAGRLISDYNNRFAAIVYDRAVFDHVLLKGNSSPTLEEWLETVNPSRQVLENRNLKIFVMNDNTRPPGHGPMELTTAFLDQAKTAGTNVVGYLSDQPMTTSERMDMIFSWLTPCRNENPDASRSGLLAAAGYTGPISEIFTTPLIVVEGTHANDLDSQRMQKTTESLAHNYAKYFHGAECVIKKDVEVTQDDINNNSLILIGNPSSNSIWSELQPQLPLKVNPAGVSYNSVKLAGNKPFQVIVRNPYADGKFILMLGAANLNFLNPLRTNNLFTAWYDCITYAPPKIIGKLDSLFDTKTNNNGNNGNNGNKTPNPKSLTPQGKK